MTLIDQLIEEIERNGVTDKDGQHWQIKGLTFDSVEMENEVPLNPDGTITLRFP